MHPPSVRVGLNCMQVCPRWRHLRSLEATRRFTGVCVLGGRRPRSVGFAGDSPGRLPDRGRAYRRVVRPAWRDRHRRRSAAARCILRGVRGRRIGSRCLHRRDRTSPSHRPTIRASHRCRAIRHDMHRGWPSRIPQFHFPRSASCNTEVKPSAVSAAAVAELTGSGVCECKAHRLSTHRAKSAQGTGRICTLHWRNSLQASSGCSSEMRFLLSSPAFCVHFRNETLVYAVGSLKRVRYSALTVSGLRDMDVVGSPAQCCRDLGRQPHETVTLVVKQVLVVCGTMSCFVEAEPQLRSANRLKPLELLHDAKCNPSSIYFRRGTTRHHGGDFWRCIGG